MRILRRIDLERSEEILERLEAYVREVVREIDPEEIILFGSFARGDFSEASDIDLVVIADWKEEFLDRIERLLRLNRFGLPIEPIGYTREEIEKMRRDGNRFVERILEEGKVIYRKKLKEEKT